MFLFRWRHSRAMLLNPLMYSQEWQWWMFRVSLMSISVMNHYKLDYRNLNARDFINYLSTRCEQLPKIEWCRTRDESVTVLSNCSPAFHPLSSGVWRQTWSFKLFAFICFLYNLNLIASNRASLCSTITQLFTVLFIIVYFCPCDIFVSVS